ncbi:uncharacterized protein LOC127738939 [Mytilus californianus]|uniref:uncharacterized protein LOC127738939 n=1 Tax=Mytilus californianus TaxID=6549 RepID=UPI0022483DFC|nr:uncharacterized protein LOC127738939 [Mytilus californianus]
MKILYLASFAVLQFHFCSSLSVEILKPNSTGPEAALVIVPGAYITGAAYKPLAQVIQKNSNLKLWVALLDGFFNKLPNPLQLPIVFKKAVNELLKAGYKGKKVFLAGHSLGGEVAALYGQKANHILDGVLLFASYITKNNKLKEYPFPVLTISGDLDGLTRITRIVDTFEELQEDVKSDPEQIYRTPVIVMESINHGQFASGQLPKTVTDHDLNPEVSQSVAYNTIANYSNAFMVVVRNDTDTNVTQAENILEDGYTKTTTMMQPLSKVKALDQNPEFTSHWTNTAQELVVSLKNITGVEFINYEDESLDILPKQSRVLIPSDNIKIESLTTLWMQPNPLDSTTSPLSPLQLKATMKSQEAVKKILPSSQFGIPASCKEVNQNAYELAFAKSSPMAKERYTSRGRRIIFNDDVSVSSEFQWVRSQLDLNYNQTGLYVTAARFQTGMSEPTKSYSGQNDCTLISPFRAMEWIYIDSLKYTTSQIKSNST